MCWQVLKTPYRNTDSRMLKVIDDLACENCSEDLVEFVRAAKGVSFPEDPQGLIPLEDRVRHLVTSNKNRDALGRTVYLQSGPPNEYMEYVPPELAKMQGQERKAAERALKAVHASKYCVGPMILRKGESYYFSGGAAEEVVVEQTTLTSGEELKLISWHEGSNGRLLTVVEAIEQGGVQVTLDPALITAKDGGVEYEATVPPLLYGRVMSSYKSQAREFKKIEVHAGGCQGEDNQLLTMISRGMGNPWAGTLKVTGIALARAGAPQPDLEKKMRSHKKSLLIAKLLGKKVDAEKYARVRAEVLEADPHWAQVEKAIEGRVLSAEG